MRISVSEAKAQLTDLVRRAEAGRRESCSRVTARTSRGFRRSGRAPLDRGARRRILDDGARGGRRRARQRAERARSQDFLYGEDGMPK